MFKNMTLYRTAPTWQISLDQLEAALQTEPFVACDLTQEKSVGWLAPRGQAGGALVESVGGHWLMKLMVETKAVPKSVIDRKVQQRAEQIELATGHKPGKKQMRQLKDDARLELLPMAFTKQGTCLVWIEPNARFLVVDAASQSRADEVLTCLAKAVTGLGAVLVQTAVSPTQAMSDWLVSQQGPAGFSVDRECELKAPDDSKAAVRYAHHALDIAEVPQHITGGKLPTRLAMTWQGRVSFVLTQTLQIKKLTFINGTFQQDAATSKADRFDADAAIATGEMAELIPNLLDALGGELVVASALAGAPLLATAATHPAHSAAFAGSDDAPF